MAIYQRTENGTTETVSLKEALAEINHAMTAGKRDVRKMSSITGTDYVIEYKDGRNVRLAVSDDAEAETEDWASTRTGNDKHRFDAEGRALCNRRYLAYDRHVSETDRRVRRTRSEMENSEFGHLYTFCPGCSAI